MHCQRAGLIYEQYAGGINKLHFACNAAGQEN